jgi:hypothetical protein
MMKYKQFLNLIEGGNVQLGTPTEIKAGKGGPKAAAFATKQRSGIAADIHGALLSFADRVHKQHAVHIFGKDSIALKEPRPGKDKKEHAPSAYTAGSTKFLYHPKVSDSEYAKKVVSIVNGKKVSQTGDVDTLMNGDHKDHMIHTLSSMPAGTKLGNTTFLGMKPGSGETHMLLQHPDHEHPIQVDLNHAKYDGEHPSEGAQFSRSGGSIDDRAEGIKGKHLNMLQNSAAKSLGMKKGPKGLKAGDATPASYGEETPTGISKKLFGDNADHEKVESFSGFAQLIKKHIPTSKHQEIFDHFSGSLEKDPDGAESHKPAIDALRKHLFGPEKK